MTRLTSIRENLLRELSGSTARLSFINTRLILSIGVNLDEISPMDDDDTRKVEEAVKILRKMGFLKEGGDGA